MEDRMVDWASCLLTSVGMTQYENHVLFLLSLISTVLGIVIALTRNVILPIAKKIKSKDLKPEDITDALEETKRISDEIVEDLADDGKLNGSNKT